nr:MAG TPA: hypothetical protein [Caudoviricetes sp.]
MCTNKEMLLSGNAVMASGLFGTLTSPICFRL